MVSHLTEYLDFYKRTNEPGYAVLVVGDWGVGKTYQVLQALQPQERYYVSLFGLSSATEIHSAVLAEVDPTLSGAKRLFSGIEEKAAAGGHWATALGSLAAAAVGAALRKDIEVDRTLIFDDLERSSVEPKDLMGVVNSYLEHRGTRVVVLAHDEKLAEGLTEMKEKLFGQTIRVEPLIAEAFDKFNAELNTADKREFIGNLKNSIIDIFEQSNTKSLRILRHAVEDLGRMHDALAPEHLAHEGAMSELIPFFCAFDLEVRAGGISAFQLRDRRMTRFRHLLKDRQAKREQQEVDKPPLVAAGDKYIAVDLESTILTDEALVEMLIEGKYRQQTIRQALDGSHFFIKPKESPPWKVVINFDALPDDVVDSAAALMQEQFNGRTVTDPGEMLHIFALRMMMAENGVVDDKTIESVASECFEYIDVLLADGRLPPNPTRWPIDDGFSDSYDGYSYWITDATQEHFRSVRDHLIEAGSRALRSRFPEFAREVLEYVRTDGQKFIEHVCYAREGTGKFARIPILAHIDSREFVAAWFESPNKNWRLISMGLTSRYEGGSLQRDLSEERDWIRQVLDIADAEAEAADGFRALRMRRTIHPKLSSLEK